MRHTPSASLPRSSAVAFRSVSRQLSGTPRPEYIMLAQAGRAAQQPCESHLVCERLHILMVSRWGNRRRREAGRRRLRCSRPVVMARRRHFVREQRHAAAARRLILLACGLVMRAARDALRPRRKLRHRGSRPSGARHLARIGRLPPSVRPRDGSSSARRGKEREALGAVAVGQLHAEPPAHPRHGGEEDERGEHERDDADRDGDVRRAVCRRVWREGQERRGRGGRRRVERRGHRAGLRGA
mmetsp:Transcript_30110/g.63257  ORF Transcript_30110/g.63257 Transcript_30110/m.63257 type:complete len:242 (-) Transcript_30110:248-973(-)